LNEQQFIKYSSMSGWALKLIRGNNMHLS